jgi:ATP-dependent helicase/nuclease subunit B
MEKILYETKLGESMRESFLQEAASYPYGSALFLVPNLFFRNLVRRRGVVKVTTIDAIPREILRLNGKENGKNLVSRYTQRCIVEQAINYLAEKGKLPYFKGLVGKKGFSDSVLHLLEELETSYVSPEEFKEAVLGWNREASQGGARDLEVTLIYSVYQTIMDSRNLCDLAGLYDDALTVLSDASSVVPWKKLYFSEFNQLNGLQSQLLKALSVRCDISFGLFYDEARPELSAVTRKLQEDLIGMGFLVRKMDGKTQREKDLAHFVEHWQGTAAAPVPATHVFLGEAVSVDSEIKLVLTDIKEKLKSGVSPSDILILVRNFNDYQGLGRYMHEYGLESTLADVTDLLGQPLPDFLTKLFEAALFPNDLSVWKALFRTTLARDLWHVDREALDEACRQTYIGTVREYVALLGRQHDVPDLTPLFNELKQSHPIAQWHTLLKGQLASWDLVSTWGTRYQKGQVTLEQVSTMVQTQELVTDFIDGLETVFEQCGWTDESIGLDAIYRYWTETFRGTVVTLQKGNEKGLRIMEASDIQGVPYPYVYILGVRDGIFPCVPRESWLYSDSERSELNALGVPLSLSARELERDRYFFASSVALARKEVRLSWYADDDGGPSYYIDMLRRFFTEDSLPVTSYRNDPLRCASADQMVNYLAEADDWGSRDKAWLEGKLGKDYFTKREHQIHRWDEDRSYNGQVKLEQKALHLSASQLDTFLDCPFWYLFSHIWGLDKEDEKTVMPEANVIGTLFHMTLARFMGNHLGQALFQQDRETLKKELERVFLEVWEEMKDEIPQSAFTEHLKNDYLHVLMRWLDSELSYEEDSPNGMKPALVEKAFGRKYSEWPALTMQVDEEPVYLSGQVDRIDSNGKEYLIMDYKTGTHASGAKIDRGLDVQLPLYVKAAVKNLGITEESVNGAVYNEIIRGARAGGFWSQAAKDAHIANKYTRTKPLSEILTITDETIAGAVRRMRAGDFAAEPLDGKCSPYCPARDVCRIKENRRMGLEDLQEDNHG